MHIIIVINTFRFELNTSSPTEFGVIICVLNINTGYFLSGVLFPKVIFGIVMFRIISELITGHFKRCGFCFAGLYGAVIRDGKVKIFIQFRVSLRCRCFDKVIDPGLKVSFYDVLIVDISESIVLCERTAAAEILPGVYRLFLAVVIEGYRSACQDLSLCVRFYEICVGAIYLKIFHCKDPVFRRRVAVDPVPAAVLAFGKSASGALCQGER